MRGNATAGSGPLPQCMALRGIVWLQGERESTPAKSPFFYFDGVRRNSDSIKHNPKLIPWDGDLWAQQFVHLVEELRALTGAPRLAVVVGRVLPHPWRHSRELGVHVSPAWAGEGSKLVRAQQQLAVSNLTAAGTAAALVDLDNVTINQEIVKLHGFADVAHVDFAGGVEAGRRFGEAMVELLHGRRGSA